VGPAPAAFADIEFGASLSLWQFVQTHTNTSAGAEKTRIKRVGVNEKAAPGEK
jgi:hypothetical protein